MLSDRIYKQVEIVMEKELCQICHHRIAEHKFVRVSNGVTTSYRICSHCKALMDNKYQELKAEAARKAIPPEKRVCGLCGTTLQEFSATGVLGCENCYKVFDDYLYSYVQGYHGAVSHVGMDANPPAPIDVETLYRELAECVKKEEYDRAVAIRKKIDRIMGKSDD